MSSGVWILQKADWSLLKYNCNVSQDFFSECWLQSCKMIVRPRTSIEYQQLRSCYAYEILATFNFVTPLPNTYWNKTDKRRLKRTYAIAIGTYSCHTTHSLPVIEPLLLKWGLINLFIQQICSCRPWPSSWLSARVILVHRTWLPFRDVSTFVLFLRPEISIYDNRTL